MIIQMMAEGVKIEMICIVFLLVNLVLLDGILAQQDSQFTQYMYNTQTINPAYVGTKGELVLNALYRAQWLGMDGAPETMNFVLDAPVGALGKVGLGLSMVQDKIGPSDESTVAMDFSYSIFLNDVFLLSFGLKGGMGLLNVDYSKLNIQDPTDNLQMYDIDGRLMPMAGFGIYLHDDEKMYVGVSVPNVLKTTYYDDTSVSNATKRATMYFMGGYVMDINDRLKVKPAVLAKTTKGAPLAIDLSTNLVFDERFSLGVSYRFSSSAACLAAFQLSPQVMVGYAYDYGVQGLSRYSSGTHEVFLRFYPGLFKKSWTTYRDY